MAVQRVLIVTGWFPTATNPVGGLFVRRQAEALSDAGLTVRVLHLRAGAESAEPVQSADDRRLVVETAAVPVRLRVVQEFVAVARVLRTIRRFRPDVVHAHVFDVGLAAVVAGRLARVPVVVTEHWSRLLRGLRWFERPRARLAYRGAHRVVAVGHALARRVSDLSGRDDVVVVPNVVVTAGSVRALDDAPPPFRLVTVGSLTALKAQATLIDALAVLANDRGLDIHLTIAGDGPEAVALHDQAAEKGVVHLVEFMGRVAPADVEEILRRSHVFVLSSRVETFSVATAEALSIGLPVVVTGCGGPEDFVGPDDGVVVAIDDVNALADGIAAVLANWGAWSAPAIADRARHQFGPDTIACRLVEIYEAM